MAWTTPVIHATGDVVTASDWNIDSNDLTFLYGDISWTAVTYSNSWVDFGGTVPAGAFRKVGTRVVLRGTMKSGTLGAAAFTLPSGYRPTGNIFFACNSNNAFGQMSIASSGVATPATGASNVSFSLDGITFDTI